MERTPSTLPQMDPSLPDAQASSGTTDAPPVTDVWHDASLDKRTPSQRASRTEPLLVPGYSAVLLLLFSTALVVPYGFSDSYNVLADALKGRLYQYDLQLVSYGRPVYAVLAHLAFSAMHSIDDFPYLRFAAVIGIGLLAWTLYHALRLAGFRQPYALSLPLLICTLPPFELYIGWEDCAFFPYAAALAGAALIVLDRAIQQSSVRKRLLFAGAALVLLTIAMMIYQPAAMMFWVCAAILLLGRQAALKSAARRLGVYGLVMAISLGVDYAESKLLPEILYGTSYPSNRTDLLTQPVTKALWFLREPLVNAFNLWNLEPRISIAGIIAIFSLGGLFLFLPGKLAERSGKLLIALVLLPLSYLPNLVVQENYATYRTEAALTSLVALYAGFALLGWLAYALQTPAVKKALMVRQLAPSKAQNNLAAGLLVAGIMVGGLMAANNVTRYLIVPQAEELSFMAAQLNSPSLAQATSIYIILCAPSDTISPVLRYDEFGRPSCSQFWAPGPMAYLLLREQHPSRVSMPIIVQSPGGPINPPPGSLVIDTRLLKNYRVAAAP